MQLKWKLFKKMYPTICTKCGGLSDIKEYCEKCGAKDSFRETTKEDWVKDKAEK